MLTLELLAADPLLARLWQRARSRIEESGADLGSASISISLPSDDERSAIELLLGVKFKGAKLSIPLDRLDAALRASRLRKGLLDVLAVTGPLRNRAVERSAAAAAEEAFWAAATGHRSLAKHPSLADWLSQLRSTGYLRRLVSEDESALLAGGLDILRLLPADGVSRAVLAGAEFGNAHALDDERPLARLVLSALAHLDGRPPPGRAEARRDLWTRWGVFLDDVASTVLVLNLRPRPTGPVTKALGLYATAAVPAPVTLQMIQSEPLEWPEPRAIWVCENATVLAVAARRIGTRCQPMVCVNGMLSVAARRLLVSLRLAGCQLHYHGDFDGGGIRIGNVVIGEIGAEPWRFGAEDYVRALGGARKSLRLRGKVPLARWDSELTTAMQRELIGVHEEEIIDQVLTELGS